MPRHPRPRISNAIYHVTARGNRRAPILTTQAEFRRFLALLSETIELFGWKCLAYCLMTNHYHLLVRTPKPNVSEGMQRLNAAYARWFNRRHGYEGHLFQRRFHSALVESDWHLLEACRYIVLNPVRAGLTSHPGEWRWSSYRATARASSDETSLALEEVLRFFGRENDRAGAAFRAFVDDAPSSRPS